MSAIQEQIIVAGASSVIRVLVEKLFSRKSPKASQASIVGKWHFAWTVNQPEDFEPKRIDDLVVLKVSKKGIVSGTGENPFYGQYVLTGTDSPYAITLAYQGKTKTSNLPGICLIIKSPADNQMKGVWWQYGRKHSLIGGAVVMSRDS